MFYKDVHVVEKALKLIGRRKREVRWLKNWARRVEMCVEGLVEWVRMVMVGYEKSAQTKRR